MKLGRPVLWLACRHHVYELIAKDPWVEVLGSNSTCPDEMICKRFTEWWDKNPDVPKTFSAARCPSVFRDDDPFFVKCREEVQDLAQWLNFNPASAKSSCPRGDYDELLQLVMVSVLTVLSSQRYKEINFKCFLLMGFSLLQNRFSTTLKHLIS